MLSLLSLKRQNNIMKRYFVDPKINEGSKKFCFNLASDLFSFYTKHTVF